MGKFDAYDPTYSAISDPDDDPAKVLAGLVSPAPAQSLVMPPPDSPAQSAPGQSTPRTGNLAMAPQQAQPKRSGPDMLPGRAALPETITPASNPNTVSATMRGGAVGAVQPAMPAANPAGRNVVIRDMDGRPAGIARALAAGIPNASLRPAGQPALQPAQAGMGLQPALRTAPYQPGVPLATQQAQRMQAYNAAGGPALYAASQSPTSTDTANPDPNASLRPAGSNPAMGLLPATAQPQVNAPSQMDRDQARLDYLKNSGSGISQIKNPVGKVAATAGDIALRLFAPGIEPFIAGTEGHHQLLLGQQQQIVGNDQAQALQQANIADVNSQTAERQALGNKADRYDPNATKTVTTADGVMAFNPASGQYDKKVGDAPDKLNKYQIITAGDGSMFRIDPADPQHPDPIIGPDGKQLTGKQESKYVQLEGADGKPHTVEVDSKGNTIKDLGATGEKTPRISVSTGTWSLEEDKDGKPILMNTKTGETKDAGGVQKSGTAAKAQAAVDKVNQPVDAAMNYANDYLTNGRFTGSGDEALQEKFFELAKPSVGFRMTQPQIDLLQNSRSWMNSAVAHLRHATTGTWFSDDQRSEIVQTMKDLAAAKKRSGPGTQGSSPSSTSPGSFKWGDHPVVKP